jgi:Cdc6-like AAA superfamily ATPase
MLPAKPKIFHGRDSELTEIISMLKQESPRIAILGAAGMGKTSLAREVLHHADVVAKYEDRYFVPCDSATSSIEVAALIGAYIGLKPGKDLTKPVLAYLTERPTVLLILDNLETVWEPIELRQGVEELLSLLTDLPISLIVSILLFQHMTPTNSHVDHNARC